MENLGAENNKNANALQDLIAVYGCSDSESDDNPSIDNVVNDDLEEDTVGLSPMVLKNNIINACAHGPLSGGASALPDTNVTRHMIIDSPESGVVEYEVTEYRDLTNELDASFSSSDSSTDVDSVKDVEEISASDDDEGRGKTTKPEQPRVFGELGLEDLPPIEDLAISLPAQETAPIGIVANIVDKLVIVRANPGRPAVDLDSVLFLEKGAKTLGKVFDVFGPVTEPHYCIRFNSVDHILERGVQPGMDVYIAPQSQHTNYVFLAELMKIKGSDASWLNDIEPPLHQLDFSDDEEERKANRIRKEQKKQQPESESQPSDVTDKRKPQEQKQNTNQRPSNCSSRFGSGPSNRIRNPFVAGSRRNPNSYPRFVRSWSNPNDPWLCPPPHMNIRPPPGFSPRPPFEGNPHLRPRTPPMHPNGDFMNPSPFNGAPSYPNMPPIYPASYSFQTPFMNTFQYRTPVTHTVPPSAPIVGPAFFPPNVPAPLPQWLVNEGFPAPPGL